MARFVNITSVTYNRLEFTEKWLEGIIDTLGEGKSKIPYKITVVDNGSTDGTVDFLKGHFQAGNIHNLLLLGANHGVARAANFGWKKEPDADYFLKLDNDMVAKKEDWLAPMVDVLTKVPLGTVGYSVETNSYPLTDLKGCKIRLKQSNIGGACLLVPKRTNDLIGFFCEDYAPYAEEDADYHFRLVLAGRFNAYMEDEDAFFHLPAGKAAVIDVRNSTFEAKDGQEEFIHAEYRKFKDESRRMVIPKFQENVKQYQNRMKSIYCDSPHYKEWKGKWERGK